VQPEGTSRSQPLQPLHAALVNFHQSPGKYQVALREPALLFACVKEILQLAIGRDGMTAPPGAPSDPLVAEAARFFVRTALLHRTADHYALLGLDRSADEAAVKNRYRLLMRLLHPDFSSGGPHWPGDAAVRVNLAYATLSSPVERQKYDNPAPPPQPAWQPPRAQAPVRHRSREGPKRARRVKRLVIAGSFAVAMALMAALFIGSQTSMDQLVQRPLPAEPVATEPALALAVALAPAPVPVPASALAAEPASAAAVALAPPAPEPVIQPTPPQALRAAAATPPVVHEPAPPVRIEPAAALAVAAAVIVPPAIVPAAIPPPAIPPAAIPAAAPPAPPPVVVATSSVTLAEAHPLLAKLLQLMESGQGDRMLSVLEPNARNSASAQAFLRQYNNLVVGARPLSLSSAQFKAEPRNGRLLVTGRILVRVGEQLEAVNKELSVQAEFAHTDGAVVMTRLAWTPN